jgi:glycine cleavage system H protein
MAAKKDKPKKKVTKKTSKPKKQIKKTKEEEIKDEAEILEETTQAEEKTAIKKAQKESLYFTETHEWIKVVGEEGVVGITDFAVKKLTDLVHIELPEVGDEVVQGNAFGSIESVKAVSDLNAPVSGKVTEVNEEVISNLDLISNDPYDEGWLIKISISDPTEFDSLMTKKDYENYIKTLEEEEEE